MTKEQFNRERDYCAAIALAKTLLKQGVIDEQDFRAIQRGALKQLRPTISGLREDGI